jgi:hypothetical protein
LITVDDLKDDASFLVIPLDTLQLQADTLNVLEGRLDISSFSQERQQQIMNYYRFSAEFQNKNSPQKPANRIRETLDLI